MSRTEFWTRYPQGFRVSRPDHYAGINWVNTWADDVENGALLNLNRQWKITCSLTYKSEIFIDIKIKAVSKMKHPTFHQ